MDGRALQLSVADRLLRTALALPIEFHDDAELHPRAMELAARFNRPASYDAHDPALAERLAIDFWTTDEHLYNAVHRQLPWVNFIAP